MGSQGSPSSYSPFSPYSPFPASLFTGMLGIAYFSVIGLAILFSPILVAILSLTAWAIARGVPFKPAFGWGWQRFWRYPLQWWWAAVVINGAAGIGAILCYVGMLLTFPWAALAAAEIAGYEGEPADDIVDISAMP